MATLHAHIATAALSERCKCDLVNHLEQLELHDATLPKLPVTLPDAQALPSAVHATTVSFATKTRPAHAHATAAAAALSRNKAAHHAVLQAVSTRTCALASSHMKQCTTRYRDYPGNDRVINRSDDACGGAAYASTAAMPFRDARRRDELSGPQWCFAARYATALASQGSKRNTNNKKTGKEDQHNEGDNGDGAEDALLPPLPDDAATRAAVDAYTRAFRRYTHRAPTARELAEVRQLVFAFDEHGHVGVVQRPHACYPHVHMTSVPRYCVRCASQTYRPELPPVHAARDRFPGTVPVWSSTKNLHTLVSSHPHTAVADDTRLCGATSTNIVSGGGSSSKNRVDTGASATAQSMRFTMTQSQ